jgi:prephenate dehydrogenase
MNGPDFDLKGSRVAIVGLGLMGGSLALALRGRCAALYGIDPQRAVLDLALSRRMVDRAGSDPAALLPDADLVILSAPVPAILSLIDQLPRFMPNPCVVIDLGSTKKMIVESMARLPRRFDPVGGHPICGKEKLSLVNAERTLYRGAPFILTPLERTSARALAAAVRVIEAVGGRVMQLQAAEHDRILAAVSHLPYLLSAALARGTPREAAPFLGPGFKSASRLAGTPASMMLGVLGSNRHNVLDALRVVQRQLAEIESVLAADDSAGLESALREAQENYQALVP